MGIKKGEKMEEENTRFKIIKDALKEIPLRLKYKVLSRMMLDSSQGVSVHRMELLKGEGDSDLRNAFLAHIAELTVGFSKREREEADAIVDSYIQFYKNQEFSSSMKYFIMKSDHTKRSLSDKGNIISGKEYPIHRLSELVEEAISYGYEVSFQKDKKRGFADAYVFFFKRSK